MSNNIIEHVAAIVVTYNRLDLLKKCIEGLRNQSCNGFSIIVVNNGSTDGTKDWLHAQKDLIVINQDNLGGAGGFYTGMKFAFENGYEWIWMMDDDGYADKYQLRYLLDGAKAVDSKYVNALVCDIENPDFLAFGLQIDKKPISTRNEAQEYRYIPNCIAPFNGTLIHRDVVEKIGLIKKEMFIWGDETEYTQRARKNGFVSYTITEAIHLHPRPKYSPSNVIPYVSKFKVEIPPLNRCKIKYRNIGYNSRYATPIGRIWKVFLYISYYLLRFDVVGFIRFCRYYWMGFTNKYGD